MTDLFFGGSFDPVHIGHLFAAEEARLRTGAHRVLFVPTGKNPLKPGAAVAGGEERRRMLERALVGNDSFELCDVELRNEGPHFTLDTVTDLIETGLLAPDAGLVIGDDLLSELNRWRGWEQLLRLVRLVVLARDGFRRSDVPAPARDRAIVIDDLTVPVSSTAVRTRLREGRSVRYLVPEGVFDFIHEHALYR